MSKDGFVQVPPNSTGERVDCASLSVDGTTVVRQRVVIADNQGSANFATVVNNRLMVAATFSAGLTVSVGPISSITEVGKISSTVTVAGTVNISSMPAIAVSIGAVAISGTALIAGAVTIAALPAVAVSGTAVVTVASFTGKVAISATALVAGTVTLGAGAAHVGEVNVSLMPVLNVNPVAISGTAVVTGVVNISSMPSIAVSIGAVAISGTATITGTVNISSMPAISIGPISKIDMISATVTVAGSVGINSGTLVLSGRLDGISATVTVAGTVNISTMPAVAVSIGAVAISGTALIAGAVTIASLPAVAISGTATVTGTVNVTAGARINGFVSHSATINLTGIFPVEIGLRALQTAATPVASGMATLVWGDNQGRLVVVANNPSNVPSASQGPKTVAISTSATVTLIAAQGAGNSIYVDALLATNGSANLTELDLFEASATAAAVVRQFLAASGGGFTIPFNPPWEISANTALNMRLTVNASDVLVTVHFHVGPT